MFLCLPNYINFNFFYVFIWTIIDLGETDLGLYPAGLDRTSAFGCLYNLKFSFSLISEKLTFTSESELSLSKNNVFWLIIPVPSIDILNVYFLLFLMTSCGGVERSMWIYALLHLHMLVCAYMCTWRPKTDSGVIF